jgi:hypothetical protein
VAMVFLAERAVKACWDLAILASFKFLQPAFAAFASQQSLRDARNMIRNRRILYYRHILLKYHVAVVIDWLVY